ncbi:MAG: hypothetical protein WA717_01860 [Methyloceanibacter sp.]|jgi:hypothetical protein
MRRSKVEVALLLAGLLVVPLAEPAFAACQVISATHGGHWKGEALSMSQALAARSASALKAEKKWRSITVKAHAVKPDPFFKTVRPQVSSDVIVGSFVTARTYTTCFTGITVPFVCTSGSEVCGN